MLTNPWLGLLFRLTEGKAMNNNLEIGKIVNTHGLRGDVKIMPWCDDPSVFDELAYVCIGEDEFEIEKSRVHKNMVILKLDGIDDINTAERYRNKVLTVPREELGDLPEGTYYICDLLGCEVVTADGRVLGKIEDIIKTGSNDVYDVRNAEGVQTLIPVIDEVVKSVDTEGKRIVIEPLKGMLD